MLSLPACVAGFHRRLCEADERTALADDWFLTETRSANRALVFFLCARLAALQPLGTLVFFAFLTSIICQPNVGNGAI